MKNQIKELSKKLSHHKSWEEVFEPFVTRKS